YGEIFQRSKEARHYEKLTSAGSSDEVAGETRLQPISRGDCRRPYRALSTTFRRVVLASGAVRRSCGGRKRRYESQASCCYIDDPGTGDLSAQFVSRELARKVVG